MAGKAVALTLASGAFSAALTVLLLRRREDRARGSWRLEGGESIDPRHHVAPEFQAGGRAALPRPHWRRFNGVSRNSVPGGSYVWRLVLTGGPCGGRSTALAVIARELRRRGVDVYAVPEAPTTLINGGCRPPTMCIADDVAAEEPCAEEPSAGSRDARAAPVAKSGLARRFAAPLGTAAEQLATFETGLLQLQLALERSFVKIAQGTGRPTVVVMDRGLLDVAAYLPSDGSQWRRILTQLELDEPQLLGRYDLVLHLRTAADGATEHFPDERLRNDPSCESQAYVGLEADPTLQRGQALAHARALDARLERAWDQHPRRIIVHNDGAFRDKMQSVLDHVTNLVLAPGLAGVL